MRARSLAPGLVFLCCLGYVLESGRMVLTGNGEELPDPFLRGLVSASGGATASP